MNGQWFGKVNTYFPDQSFEPGNLVKYTSSLLLTWYVLSKESYINLVISEVFPTEKEKICKVYKRIRLLA